MGANILVMKKLILVLSFLNCACCIYAQQKKIDSLKRLLSTSSSDTSTVTLQRKLAHSYLYSKPDSSFLLAQQGLVLATKINFLEGQAKCYKEIGEAKEQMGSYPDAMQDYLKYLRIAEKLNLQFDIAQALIDIGLLYQEQEEYKPAIRYTLKAKTLLDIKNKKIR